MHHPDLPSREVSCPDLERAVGRPASKCQLLQGPPQLQWAALLGVTNHSQTHNLQLTTGKWVMDNIKSQTFSSMLDNSVGQNSLYSILPGWLRFVEGCIPVQLLFSTQFCFLPFYSGCCSVINIFHLKLQLSICFWRTQPATWCERI